MVYEAKQGVDWKRGRTGEGLQKAGRFIVLHNADKRPTGDGQRRDVLFVKSCGNPK